MGPSGNQETPQSRRHMVHKKGDISMDNQRPHVLHSPTSTQVTESQKSDKDRFIAHITII